MTWRQSVQAAVFATLVLLGAVACAAPREIEPFRYDFDARRGLFAPTRVAINRNLPVATRFLDRLDAVAQALGDSGAFVAFGPRVDSAYVLDLTLERLTDDFSSVSAGGGGQHGGVGAAVALTGGRHTHRLTAVLYRDGESTHAYRYVGDFETPWRVAGDARLPRRGAEDLLIANLVNRLVRDLDRDDALERRAPDPASAPSP